ncbi:uncharacterized protein LOC144631557 [Oculina patagonica]
MPRKRICDNLINKKWLPYKDAHMMPHVPGIYVFGVKRPRARTIDYFYTPLYLGQSIDVNKRTRTHRYGVQKIDAFIKRNLKRNGGKNLAVKWIKDPNHKKNERAYIRCLEELLHTLEFNVYGGNH